MDMKNFLQPGQSLDVVAPTGGVVSGLPVIIGSLIGISAVTAVAGVLISMQLSGCYSLPKTTGQAWATGAKIYWDATNKLATTTSAGNTLIGTVIADALSADTIGSIRLGPTTV
jgi:predicted RecA/RadA family phage recombinase